MQAKVTYIQLLTLPPERLQLLTICFELFMSQQITDLSQEAESNLHEHTRQRNCVYSVVWVSQWLAHLF